MSDMAEVVVLVEGQTEALFVKHLLIPYLGPKQIYLTPIVLNKPGSKGGDVKFARAKNDIGRHLKQWSNTWITTMVDYYGIKSDWPGYNESKQQQTHIKKAQIMNEATVAEVQRLFPEHNRNSRFIPYVSMYELEALYFSDPDLVANELGISVQVVDAILAECGEPEKINDRPDTSPSRRLSLLNDRFKKTVNGLAIAKNIGIPRMREACPLFDQWLARLETLTGASHE